jgi:hypothetical protein
MQPLKKQILDQKQKSFEPHRTLKKQHSAGQFEKYPIDDDF